MIWPRVPVAAIRAGGDSRLVALSQHGRQRHQTQGNHSCADDAGAGGHQHAHDDDGHREATPCTLHEGAQRSEQFLGDPRLLQHHPHEDEQRHGDHGLIGHDAEQSIGQEAEIPGIEGAKQNAAEGKNQRHAAESERHAVTGEQNAKGHREHGQRYPGHSPSDE